jgi:hypothetical protein
MRLGLELVANLIATSAISALTTGFYCAAASPSPPQIARLVVDPCDGYGDDVGECGPGGYDEGGLPFCSFPDKCADIPWANCLENFVYCDNLQRIVYPCYC